MKKNKIAPHLYRIAWLMLFLIGPGLMVCADCVHSEMRMNELSEIQNGIFHLSPRHYEFYAETDPADQYIDDDQAEFFISAAEPDMELEADGNYPFSVVDHQVRDEDLEIELAGNNACGPYPQMAYLSREDIFKKEYTNRSRPPGFFVDDQYHPNFHDTKQDDSEFQKRLNPPGFFADTHHFREPFHNQNVEAVYWKLYDSEAANNEALHKSATPGEDCINGYMVGGSVRVRGWVNVWTGETHFFDRSSYERKKPKYTGKCDCSKN